MVFWNIIQKVSVIFWITFQIAVVFFWCRKTWWQAGSNNLPIPEPFQEVVDVDCLYGSYSVVEAVVPRRIFAFYTVYFH